MKISNLDHVNISVRSFDETAAWYGRVFGFEVVEVVDDEDRGLRWGVLRSGDAMLCIYEHPDIEYVDGWTLRERGTHAVAHFGLRVRDAAEWEKTILRENVTVNFGGVRDYPHSKAWYVSDPTGWEIEVVYWHKDRITFDV